MLIKLDANVEYILSSAMCSGVLALWNEISCLRNLNRVWRCSERVVLNSWHVLRVQVSGDKFVKFMNRPDNKFLLQGQSSSLRQLALWKRLQEWIYQW